MASNVTGVNIENAEATLWALRAFDSDAAKALQKGLRAAIRPIVRAAQQDVPDAPLSQWAKYGWIDRHGRNREHDLGWDAARVRRGIQVILGGKRAKGRIVSNLAGIRNANAAGAAFELIGAKTHNQMDRSLHQAGMGGPPRLILRQDTPQNRARVERDVTAAMQAAERILQRHLDRME